MNKEHSHIILGVPPTPTFSHWDVSVHGIIQTAPCVITHRAGVSSVPSDPGSEHGHIHHNSLSLKLITSKEWSIMTSLCLQATVNPQTALCVMTPPRDTGTARGTEPGARGGYLLTSNTTSASPNTPRTLNLYFSESSDVESHRGPQVCR